MTCSKYTVSCICLHNRCAQDAHPYCAFTCHGLCTHSSVFAARVPDAATIVHFSKEKKELSQPLDKLPRHATLSKFRLKR